MCFEETVIRHLCKQYKLRTGKDHEFSLSQIANKVKSLWGAHDDLSRSEAMLSKGSQAFDYISEDMRKEIQTQVKQYKAMQAKNHQSKSHLSRKAAVEAVKAISKCLEESDADSLGRGKPIKQVRSMIGPESDLKGDTDREIEISSRRKE